MIPELQNPPGAIRARQPRVPLHSRILHAAILLAMALPYWVHLGKSSIWDTNEAFYAETPRVMLTTGDYLAPQFNGAPRAQKPPLTYWAVLLSYKAFGIHEFALRVPGAAAATATLLLAYGIGLMLFNRRAALMAAILTATAPRVFVLARRLPIDILLLFFLTATIFFLVRAIQKNGTASWAMAYVCAGLGFLTKGPVAVVLPAGAYLVWALRARRRRIPDVRPWMGAAIFLAVVLPWYVLIFKAHGWTYIAPFLLRDNLERFASTPMGPLRGPFYYVSVFAMDYFPWSILALFALFLIWSGRKTDPPLKSLSYGLPIIYCGLTFLLFSLSKNKQEYYIAPMYPLASVILAAVIDKSLFSTSRRVWAWPCALLSFLFLALSGILPFGLRSFMPDLAVVLHYTSSLVFGGAGLAMAWSLIRRKTRWCFSSLAISMGILYMMCSMYYLPATERFRPVKDFCRLIEARSNGDDEAGYYGAAVPSMAFYLRRPIFEEWRAEEMRRRFESGRRVFCILTDEDYRRFTADGMLTLYILDRRPRLTVRLQTILNAGRFPEEELLLVSNQPVSNAEPGKERS